MAILRMMGVSLRMARIGFNVCVQISVFCVILCTMLCLRQHTSHRTFHSSTTDAIS